jgi:hypothetical protein
MEREQSSQLMLALVVPGATVAPVATLHIYFVVSLSLIVF